MKILKFIAGIILVIYLPGRIVAQLGDATFAPIGASWYYSPSSFGPPWVVDPLYAQFVAERDTLMQGYQARVIGCYVNTEGQMVRVDSLTKYVATSGDKVYYKVADEFQLLYDFGAAPGDTIHSRAEDFSLSLGCGSDFAGEVIDFSYIIDSVKTVVIDGEELRVQFVHSIDQYPEPNWVFWSPIVERIGYSGFGGWWWGQGEGCILESGYLRCYSDSEISWRDPNFNDNLPCDYISASSEVQVEKYTLYPNPANTHLTLPPGAEQVTLFDVTGQKLEVDRFENEVDITSYPSGLYIIRFELDGMAGVASFIKM